MYVAALVTVTFSLEIHLGFSLPSNIALLSNSAEFDCCESDQDASHSVTISHLLFTNRLAFSYKVSYRKILRQLGKDSSYQLF